MYPARELTRLAARKAALQRTIALHRAQCIGAAARAARPLAWIDRMLAWWRRLPPLATFAAAPLGWLLTRAVFPRLKIIGPLLRWGPLVLGALRGLGTAAKARLHPAPHRR
jgi:hypothetical protein